MFPWNKQFPFNHTEFTKQFQNMKPQEVENYIQSVMKNVFGNNFTNQFPFQGEVNQQSSSSESQLPKEPEIFETSDYVYVKLPITKEHIESIKIMHTTNQVIIHHFPEKNKQSSYMLPSPVKRKGTKARYINEILEIQLYKLHEHSISEVDVSYHS